jgi:hypothetical protein
MLQSICLKLSRQIAISSRLKHHIGIPLGPDGSLGMVDLQSLSTVKAAMD